MLKLESKRLKREFKIANNNLFASQILNKYSDMSFVPDGNGSEFEIHFTDGTEFSSKGLPVVDSKDGDKLSFTFAENMGVSVTLEYWVHNDKNTICKQLILNQTDDRIIDYVVLENIGIINSKTHFSVDIMEDGIIDGYRLSLGQPFYIDSLFFGCEFPATENRIVHGAGKIIYYLGKNVGKNYSCPVTVMGAARDNSIVEVKKAFFEYIEFISTPSPLRFQYNSWYDHMLKIDEKVILDSFKEISKGLSFHNAPKLDAYVLDDGWANYRAKFWEIDKRKFPDGFDKISKQCRSMGSSFGLWLSPRGGYNYTKSFAKRIEKAENGYFNKDAQDICIASEKYISKLEDFLIDMCDKQDISYLKLDGFCYKPCTNPKHDHIVGGENDMYFTTELWHRWIKLFEHLRKARDMKNRNLWINMTCYVNVSPWWLQWVNSIWLNNSDDIGFAENYEEQPQVEAEITSRDARYYDSVCKKANQFPLSRFYNHEPIYGESANVDYTDNEFEKYIFWNACRGNALNELHLSNSMMSDKKWDALANAMNFQKQNYHILKNAGFIGGNPEENNIYGYISWTQEGEGIIALRNPSKERTNLTLNINKLMGAPECLKDARMEIIYGKSIKPDNTLFSYRSKLDLTLHPFESIILKFTR